MWKRRDKKAVSVRKYIQTQISENSTIGTYTDRMI